MPDLATRPSSQDCNSISPKWLVIGVNNRCNLRCKMCDVGSGNQHTVFSKNLLASEPVDMPLELFEELARQNSHHYPDCKLGYAFTEPLIYRYLDESLLLARSYGLNVSITSNGLKLRQKAAVIAESGVSDLFLSIDGPETVHNDIRGHSSSFQRAVDGIEELLKFSRRPRISIFCVITQWNIGQLQEFVNFFSHYPLERIGFMHTNFTTRAMASRHNWLYGRHYHATESNVDLIEIDKMDLDLLWQEIETISNLDSSVKLSFSPALNSRAELEVFYRQPEILLGNKCNDIDGNFMVKSDGSVIPAHGRCYNLTIGNLYQQQLPAIVNSEKLARLKRELSKAGGLFPACARCCSAF